MRQVAIAAVFSVFLTACGGDNSSSNVSAPNVGAGLGGSAASSPAVSGPGDAGASSPAASGTGDSAASSPSKTQSAALPNVSIVTDGGAAIVDKDTYIGATMTITAPDGTQAYIGHMTIKGHGNSTWGMPKKPYRLKLDSKAGILGMPKDKNWILLANYSDKTLLRNRTAFELGTRFDMAWTPRAYPVEVTLNGDYVGTYDFVEKIRVDKNRVNIADADNTVAPNLTGFILEVDERMDGAICWRTTHGVAFCIDTPDPSSDSQMAYIKEYIQRAEDALFSPNPTDPATGYSQYIDVDSVIDWFIVNELLKNNDAIFYSSVYLYKDAGGKLKFGPIWDFDLGAGNVNYSNAEYPTGWWVANSSWITQMRAADPTFEAKVRARWQALKASKIDTLPAFVDDKSQALIHSGAEKRNFDSWPILNVAVWPNAVVPGSYVGEIDYMKNWLTQRIAWMDANL